MRELFAYFPQPITANTIVEAAVVGIIIIIFAYIASGFLFLFEARPDLPLICNTWNRTHIMEKSLFLTGFFAYIFAEWTGVIRSHAMKYN